MAFISLGSKRFALPQTVTLLTASTRSVTGLVPLRSRVTGVAIMENLLAACCADRVVHALRLSSLETMGTHKER